MKKKIYKIKGKIYVTSDEEIIQYKYFSKNYYIKEEKSKK